MPALFIFLIKVNAALILFYIGYYLVLRRLTFYTLNRIYLLVALIFSTIYPLINLNSFVEHHRQLSQPVQTIIIKLRAPAENFVQPMIQHPNYWHWVEIAFWLGAFLFALKLIIQLLSLYNLYRNSKLGDVYNQSVRIVNKNISPFSFWQSIYINPEKLDPTDLQNILQHEKIHIKEWHTLDILLAEISVIFYWFNPGIWLMKKAVRENIEFITDRKIIRNGIDTKMYQYSLLNVSANTATSMTIVNHFNISMLKRRIIMMNTQGSSKSNLSRYAFLIPTVIILLLIFSFSKSGLVEKGANVFKNITSKVADIRFNTEQKASKSLQLQKIIATSHTNIFRSSKINKDTVNRSIGGLGISNKVDTSNYVLDGVKTTSDVIKQLDLAKIESIYILTAHQAEKLSYTFDHNYTVMFFFKNEGTFYGDILKEKLNKLPGFKPSNNGNEEENSGNNAIHKATPTIFFSSSENGTSGIDTTNKYEVVLIAKDSTIKKLDKIYGYGKAELTYKDFDVHADYIEYNKETKKGIASGTVFATKKTNTGDAVFKGNKFYFSLQVEN